jgi:hypothetical protein
MPRLFLPNLMFEDELGGSQQRLPLEARRLIAELSPVMGLLSNSEPESSDGLRDIVVVPSDAVPSEIPATLQHVRFVTDVEITASRLDAYELAPWGWSEQAVSIGQNYSIKHRAPDLAAVKHVNSREFLAPFDRCGSLDGSSDDRSVGMLCRTMQEIEESLERFSDEHHLAWVIKSNFSQAARNRLIGKGLHPDASQTQWLLKRFEMSEPVYAEPWLERLAECGLQFWIPTTPAAEPEVHFVGACEMLTDKMGRYRGSILRFDDENPWWQNAISHCRQIAQHAAALGFRGPIGMDCMLFRHPGCGVHWLRFCHDINGRNTMGRVALSLKPRLQPGETGFWCHSSGKTSGGHQNVFETLNVKNVRIVSTSPSRTGTQPTNLQTALLISDDCENLIQVARKILSQDIRGPFQTDHVRQRPSDQIR